MTINKVLEPISSDFISTIFKRYSADKYIKKLSSRSLITLFLMADFKELAGLRKISTDLEFDFDYQRILKLNSISPSQLYRRLIKLDTGMLREIFQVLVTKLAKGHRHIKLSSDVDALNIIDASTILKALHGMEWAQFRKGKAGIKLHLGLKYHGEQNLYPSKATVTGAKCHDVNEMLNLIDYCEGVINVLDRGYADFRKLDEITDAGGKFVVRIKNNTTTWINERFEDAKGVKFASKGPVGAASKKTRHEYYYIQKFDDEGNLLHLLTNIENLESHEKITFETVAEFYKMRWQIELFFKWIKQHFEVKHFYACTQEGTENQVYLSLIMYCLLALFKQSIITRGTLDKIR
ncbi:MULTISPECIES: IS4 family transposase, partial [unclassified Fusibacter]|uniref:IS4 family transposase n=1 Tax=unclassified Fusibacter TaxID=2624464 RepID=UPI0013E95CDA